MSTAVAVSRLAAAGRSLLQPSPRRRRCRRRRSRHQRHSANRPTIRPAAKRRSTGRLYWTTAASRVAA